MREMVSFLEQTEVVEIVRTHRWMMLCRERHGMKVLDVWNSRSEVQKFDTGPL